MARGTLPTALTDLREARLGNGSDPKCAGRRNAPSSVMQGAALTIHPTEEREMKKLSIFAALLAAVLVASFSFGSSHREAPNTAQDPTADDTDVYAFTADNAQGALTVVANWIPFEDPAGGPNFYN